MRLLLLGLLISSLSSQISLRCFYYFQSEYMIYNLRDLNDKIPHGFKVSGGRIQFNMCSSQSPLPAACSAKGITDTFGYFLSDDQSKCANILSSQISENEFVVRDKENPEQGFDLQTKGSTYRFRVTCDAQAKEPTYSISGNSIVIKSRDSCGINNEAARILDNNKYVLGALAMVLGLFLCLFGGYKWKSIVGFMSFVIGFGGIMLLFWGFVNFKQSTTAYVIIGVIALLVGIFFAYLSSIFAFLSYVGFGFFSGYFLSSILLATFQAPFEQWVVLLIKFSAGVLLALFCAAINTMTMVILSSVVGSFVFFYSLGHLIEYLPNLFELWEDIRAGKSLPPVYYVFFGVACFAAILAMMFQYGKVKAEEKEEGRKIYGDVYIEH